MTDTTRVDLEANSDDDSDDGFTELTRYSLETQTMQMCGLVWCPADKTCTWNQFDLAAGGQT